MIHIKNGYHHLENIFEKITSKIMSVLGNSITFILAFILVIFLLCNRDFKTEPINDTIRDIIYGISFLTLFIIQKAFNHFTASMHVKLNELVSSNKSASNAVMNVETKTEKEINLLQKEYSEIANQIDELEKNS